MKFHMILKRVLLVLALGMLAGTAAAQRATVASQLSTVIALEANDQAAYAIVLRTAATPAANFALDPSQNQCAFGVVYFGTTNNPSAADRTLFTQLATFGLAQTPMYITYTKTTTALGSPTTFKCVLTRVDASF